MLRTYMSAVTVRTATGLSVICFEAVLHNEERMRRGAAGLNTSEPEACLAERR